MARTRSADREPHGPAWPGDRGGHVWPKDREARSPDGARIRYAVLGDRGPWIVLCAGFLCPDNFWATLAPRLVAQGHRVVVLNYRGVGASSDPRPAGYRARHLTPGDYTIERMADDVAAVAAAEEITGATVLGHSMGCQVALQLWRQAPELVAALVLVAGPYASPLHTFYGRRTGAHLFPVLYLGLPLLPRPVQRAITRLPRLPVAMPVARLIRALGPHTPGDGMDLYFHHLGEVDPLVTLKIVHGMHRFDAGSWLHEVAVPTLVIVGGRDTFCPPAIGEVLLATLPDAELRTLHEATHGAPIEFPTEIADAVGDFLHRRADGPPVTADGDPDAMTAPRLDAREVRPA